MIELIIYQEHRCKRGNFELKIRVSKKERMIIVDAAIVSCDTEERMKETKRKLKLGFSLLDMGYFWPILGY